MSIIVSALKKLEYDKANRTSDPDDVGLESMDSTPAAPHRSSLKSALMMVLLVTGGSAATFLLMTRAEKAPAPTPPAAPHARQAAFMPATAAHLPAPLPTNRRSASSPDAIQSPTVQATQQSAPAPLTAKPPEALKKAQPGSPPTQTPAAKQHVLHASKPALKGTALPSLTVNGIALSDGDKRKAIVNGMSISIGTTIEGARVEDILLNRVRFSYGGKTFEISVGNTGP